MQFADIPKLSKFFETANSNMLTMSMNINYLIFDIMLDCDK